VNHVKYASTFSPAAAIDKETFKMVANLPTLPLVFLERCLALSEHLFAMKSGSAKLELSPSHFIFTVNHPPDMSKEPGSRSSNFPKPTKRKKTPSDLRRNALRMKKFLEEKNQPTTMPSSDAGTSLHTSPTDISPPKDEKLPSPTPSISTVTSANTEEPTHHPTPTHENQDLPDMEVDTNGPMTPEKEDVPEVLDDIDVSQDSSPDAFSFKMPISKIVDLCDWHEDLNTVQNNPNNSNTLTVAAIVCAENSNSAKGSLQKTLKKCNIRSIEPKRVNNLVEDHRANENSDTFAFEFKVNKKTIKAMILNMTKNWMPVKQSHLAGFLIQEIFFQNDE